MPANVIIADVQPTNSQPRENGAVIPAKSATKVRFGKKAEEVRSDFSAPRWPIT